MNAPRTWTPARTHWRVVVVQWGGEKHFVCTFPTRWQVDKIGGKPKPRVVEAVKAAVAKYECDVGERLISTSARLKLGRHDVWRLLRPVMMPEEDAE